MHRRQRRLLGYLGAFVLVIFLYTVSYSWAMGTFEGTSRTLWESLLVVVETFTTTGFGEDANTWTTPHLVALVVSMQFTGVFFIFMALPLFVAPWLEERISTTPPRAIDHLTEHVVICSWTGPNASLTEELSVLNVPYVVVEADRDQAVELYDNDVPVIHGDPEVLDTLRGARLQHARALVVDIDDETNASVALAASQLRSDGDLQLITFAEDPAVADYHRYAGADHVFTPRSLIGESLANKAAMAISAEVGDAVQIGDDFEIVELPVQSGAELVGTSIGDSQIRERTGVNIIGAWFRGEFVSPPSPETLIDERTVLLVAGEQEQLEALKEMTLTDERAVRSGPILIAGYGEVGSTVHQAIAETGLPTRVLDLQDKPDVDIVGDVTDEDTLGDAGLDGVSTVVIAVYDDTDAIFGTLVIRQLDPDVDIVVRANETESVEKLYRAGADYVLDLATVSGRMLASTILQEEVLSLDQQIKIVRMTVEGLVDRSIAEAGVRAQTGCTIVAVDRDGDIRTNIDPDFVFRPGDRAIVAGPDEGITDFSAQFTE